MRKPSRLLFAFTFVFAIVWIIYEVQANYEYDNTIGSYWSLGVKASTLQQKSAYLDQYVAALSHAHLEGTYDAAFLQTPDNSYDQNMVALLSLQGRMHQIQGIDESSFAYQTAMAQITGQEQGQADHLTSTFEGCWFYRNNTLLWGWHDVLVWLAMIVWGIVTGIFAFSSDYY
jgi:hypothetical protein